MNRHDARAALEFARQWTAEHLMPQASLAVLEKRYAADAENDTGESFGSSVLYGLGGILLGAAAFALLVLLEDNGFIDWRESQRIAPWLFLAWGAACAGVAFTVDLVAKKPTLGESFHVAALVAVTAAGFPRMDDFPLGLLGMAFAASLVVYRRTRFMVPFLALIAFNVSWVSIVFGQMDSKSSELSFTVWFVYAVVQLVGLVGVTRMTKWSWPVLSLGAATLLLAGTFLGFYFDVVADQIAGFTGDVELYLAILMGAVMASGLFLRLKSMVLASALVIAIDAIVGAFDVGDVIGGLIAILAVAALLIWQGGFLRRYLRED